MKINVIPDTKHKNMYRLEWPDGTKSTDAPNYVFDQETTGFYGCYNLTRANELARLIETRTRFEGELPKGEVWEFTKMGRIEC